MFMVSGGGFREERLSPDWTVNEEQRPTVQALPDFALGV
jgi:hypothetical protein